MAPALLNSVALRTKREARNVDGVMGAKTETAIRNFQRDKGLNATGELTDDTLAALDTDRGRENSER